MIDKRWLSDQVTIEPVVGQDSFQASIYGKPISFSYTRVDHSKKYTGSGANRELFANATVFFYAEHTTNFDQLSEDWLEARLTTQNGTGYIVKNIIPCTHWLNNSVWSVEMDVI